MSESEMKPEVNEIRNEVHLHEGVLESMLLWSFYFSQGAGGFLRRDEDGEFVDVEEGGLHCLIFEFIATRHPEYKVAKSFDHSTFLKKQIPKYIEFLTRGSHSRIDPKEIPQDVGMAYRYLRMALNERKYMRREIVEPSLIRFAQKMLDRDWKFLTNMMSPKSSDFGLTDRPERTSNDVGALQPRMSQFVQYVLLRKKGEPVELSMSPSAPPLVSPPEFIELLDAIAEKLQTATAAEFNMQSTEFDGTYGEHLKILIDQHNSSHPNQQVPVETYRHLFS